MSTRALRRRATLALLLASTAVQTACPGMWRRHERREDRYDQRDERRDDRQERWE